MSTVLRHFTSQIFSLANFSFAKKFQGQRHDDMNRIINGEGEGEAKVLQFFNLNCFRRTIEIIRGVNTRTLPY